jgi:hypothetical protein
MKKVLWFSRHDMTQEQAAMFSGCEITKISGSPANVHVPFEGSVNNGDNDELRPLKALIQDYDIIAVVLPIHLEQQVLGVADNKPVIKAMTSRELVKVDGEDKVVFNFNGWKRLVKIEVVLEDFSL